MLLASADSIPLFAVWPSKLANPLNNPAAIIAGINGTNIFAIILKHFLIKESLTLLLTTYLFAFQSIIVSLGILYFSAIKSDNFLALSGPTTI